ncbi:MAG: hypothetical protein HON90_03365 [Halobacteriovoraceae bacterium]|nr:hypothetical protein [Halobacteriovoraceae bacterium]
MKQILLAHPVVFAAKAIEAFLKDEGVGTYLLDDLFDFKYLIEDLAPSFLLVHEDLLEEFEETLLDQTKAFPDLKIVFIGKNEQVESKLCFIDTIIEPFDPANIYSHLLRLESQA